MQNFETTFNNLNEIDKKCINAYRSAREFKNIGTQPVVINNNRMYPVIIASIVNNALACELFLKSIIIMNTRYTYERNEMIMNNGFLNGICTVLEEIGRNKILEKYNLNMFESFI